MVGVNENTILDCVYIALVSSVFRSVGVSDDGIIVGGDEERESWVREASFNFGEKDLWGGRDKVVCCDAVDDVVRED